MKIHFVICLLLFLVTSIPITTATEVTAYNLSVSDSLNFGQTLNASNVTSLSVNITDDATKSHPYDINYTGCILEWRADGDFNDTQGVNTLTGYNVAFDDGKYNEAGVFIPSNLPYVDCGNDISLSIVGDLTVSAWVEKDIIDSCITIVDKSYMHEYLFRIGSNNKLQVYQGDGTYELISGNGIIGTELTHIGFTRNVTTKKINFYINSVHDAEVSYNKIINASSNIVTIGYRHDFPPNYQWFSGSIDEVLIYNRSLSATEIKSHYLDKLELFQCNTSANSTLSTEWNSSSNNPLSIPYGAGEFFSLLNFTVPDTVVQNGITIYDYPSTVQFDAVATVEPRLPGTFLYPNSTYSVGCYGRLISEVVYETGINFSDIDTFNLLTTGDMETLSEDDTNYIPSIDKDAAHDGYMYGNFSLPNVEYVNFITVKTVHNRVHTNPIIMGLFNVSTQKWHAVNNSSVEIIDVELTYNITGTDIIKYTTLVDNTLNLSVSLNTNGDGNYDVFVDFVEVYIDYEEVPDITLEYVYNLTISNQNNISILQNDAEDLENNVNNLYLFVLLCTVFLVAALRKRGD